MNEIDVTVCGNVCADPTRKVLDTGRVVTEFRVACTPRHFDRQSQAWVDNDTIFAGVTSWGALADHVALSLHKGDPVLVYGRLRTQEWEQEGVKRMKLEISATSVGHDLSRGSSAFTSARRSDTGRVAQPADHDLEREPEPAMA